MLHAEFKIIPFVKIPKIDKTDLIDDAWKDFLIELINNEYQELVS